MIAILTMEPPEKTRDVQAACPWLAMHPGGGILLHRREGRLGGAAHVAHGEHRGELLVAFDDRGENLRMLVPVLLRAARCVRGEYEARALTQDAHDVAEDTVAAGLAELVVELAVQPHQVVDVLRLRGAVALLEHLAQLLDDRRVAVARGEPRVQALERGPDLDEVARHFRRNVGNGGAAARLHFDQSLGGERTQCLADRDAGDAELLGQAVLDQTVTGLAPAGENRAAQLLRHPLSERRMMLERHSAMIPARCTPPAQWVRLSASHAADCLASRPVDE